MSLIPGLDVHRKLEDAHADLRAVRLLLERQNALLQQLVQLMQEKQ